MKRVIDIGNCDYDHSQLRTLIEQQYDAQLVRCHGPEDGLKALREVPADLVIVNRLMDRDQRSGLDIIQQIKSDPQLAPTRVMLLTNFPEHQKAAEAAGAVPGFGKSELSKPSTQEKLAKYLGGTGKA